MSIGCTHRLSGKALTQYSRILLNQEVVNGIGITESSSRLRKRPASNLDDNSQTTCNKYLERIIPELVNEWTWRSIVFVGSESKIEDAGRRKPGTLVVSQGSVATTIPSNAIQLVMTTNTWYKQTNYCLRCGYAKKKYLQ